MAANLLEVFQEKMQAASGVCSEAADLAAAAAHACGVAAQNDCRAVAALGFDQADAGIIAEACAKAGLELLSGDIRSHADERFVALTPAQWAAAETGTLLIDSASEDLRLATMLGEIHVAVLRTGDIAPDMMALAEPMKELMASGSGYLACISGASRTADIERVLTIGVHGPTQLHVVILTGGAK